MLQALLPGGETLLPHHNTLRSLFALVDQPDQADLHVLPYTWNYYVEHGKENQARRASERAHRCTRPLVVFSNGDFTADVPFSGAAVFQRCAYKSRDRVNGNRLYALPVFVADYVDLYCQGVGAVRHKSQRPVVGFCGQAGGTVLDFAARRLVNWWRRAAYRCGLRKWEPAPYETTALRRCILGTLQRAKRLQADLILRRRYRAGYRARPKDPFHPTQVEFVNNILGTDYTLCVRGGGNFSKRFYEVLALGRIPLFIDTDCILPYEGQVNYRDYCIWVAQSEIPRLEDIICDFHNRLTEADFQALQARCRQLWLDRLSADGFWSHFGEHFAALAQAVYAS